MSARTRKRRAFLFLFTCALAACASRHYETDRTNPGYQRGDYFPHGTDARHDPNHTETYGGDSGESAVVAMVASGIYLAANRDYYKKVAISGRCFCKGAGQNSLELPCTNVEIAITDLKGKELSRTQAHDGEFAFQVKKGQSYLLRNASPKYDTASGPTRPLELGDDVVMHLVRKPSGAEK